MNSTEELGTRILCYTFNQTNTLLFVGTTKGFRIIRVEDGKITSRRDRDGEINFPVKCMQGGFSALAPMFSTQLMCAVGSVCNPRYTHNIVRYTQVYFWDEFHCDMKGEIRFRTEVKNVLIRRDKTYVYLLSTLKPIASIPTINNDRGVGAISYDKDKFVLATLDTSSGHLRIENFYLNEVKRGFMHENPISHITLDFQGNIGASASEHGTVIRVFDCMSLQVLHELRRGTSPAQVSCIAFSPDGTYILSASNRPTIHIWNLKQKQETLMSGLMKSYLPTYFNYDRSYAQLVLNADVKWTCPQTIAVGPIACFIDESLFYVANLDGLLYKCKVNQDSVIIEGTTPILDFEGQTIVEGERNWSSFD